MTIRNMQGWKAEISERDFDSYVENADGGLLAQDLSASQARLIAAAPKLLEACIQARLAINHHGIVGDPASAMLDEAIEEAEGRR